MRRKKWKYKKLESKEEIEEGKEWKKTEVRRDG